MDYLIEKISEDSGTTIYTVRYEDLEAQGLDCLLPDSDKSMLVIQCRHGMLLCRLFNTPVFSQLNIAAAIFSAPKLKDLLENKPLGLSEPAIAMGATTEMTGLELLKLFS